MADVSRSEAQKRSDDIRVFEAELARLEAQGVVGLTAAQRDAIASHHGSLLEEYRRAFDIDADPRSKQLSLGMRVASFLGALAIAASLFFLFYKFWGVFSTGAQVVTLIGCCLASLALTIVLQRREGGGGYFTKLAALVAFTCFVLDVVMLGAIFNITPSEKVLLVWSAYALALAYACDLRLLLAAGILCIGAYIAARTGTFSGMYWLDLGRRPENFFPSAVLLFAVPHVFHHRRYSGFEPVYRVFAMLFLLLPMLLLANWGAASYLDFEHNTVEGFYQVAGFVVSAVAIWWGARRSFADVVNTDITFFVIFLYTKFYDWWWDWMPKYLFFLVLGMAAVLILFVLRRLRYVGARATEVSA